jgi:methylated-DNA-[protein]-cysteine S-methyltransferase
LNSREIARAEVATPLGTLRIFVVDGVLRAVLFPEEDEEQALARLGLTARPLRPERDPAGVAGRLHAYFAGDLRALDDIPVDPGGTAFAREVRLALRRIPPGETRSYRELAAAVGRPRAVRAVGRANATNPVPIVLPCHRVIGRDGRLVGYGGGIERKAWLLRHEGASFRA